MPDFRKITLAALLGLGIAGGYAVAQGENVAYPAGFETAFIRYDVVDKLDRKTIRYLYVSRDAWEAAKSGALLPEGTVIVMEDHAARLASDESPVTDTDGRMIATDTITNVFVMEKRAGWGDLVAEDIRNGDWLYARFGADGARSDKPLTACYECHKAQESVDFTFTTFDAVAKRK